MPTETDDQLKHYRALIQSASHIEALRIRAAKLHDKKSEVSRECTEADRMYIDAIQDHQDLMYGRGEHAQGKLDFDGGAQPDRWQDHPITALGLTSKLEDVLVKGGITTIGPLESCVKGGRNWPTGVGKVGEEEIVEAFEAYWADNPGIQRQLDEESGDS